MHPLTNPDAKHYDANEEPTIQRMERELTINELIGACKFNLFKYNDRQDHKGQKKKDIEKIIDYHAFLKFLEEIEDMGLGDDIAENAYKYLGLNIKYDFEEK